MMLRIDDIRSAAKSFNDKAYPTEVYYHLLGRVHQAHSPYELGRALSHAVAWKKGKVNRDPQGFHYVPTADTFYTVSNKISGKVLGDRHRGILYSQDFYQWAVKVRHRQKFNEDPDQQKWLKKLWKKGTVMQVFVLDCLCPRVYPIVDKRVMCAYNACHPGQKPLPETGITMAAYEKYRVWWFELLGQAKLDPKTAPLNQLKEIDAGLWVLGKQ
ncbi:MAG: hypothetical protein ACRDD3_04945 [Azovibrio sp.]